MRDSLGTSSAIILKAPIAYARVRGIDTAPLLRDAGIDAAIDDFDLRIPEVRRQRFWNALADASGDPHLSLAYAAYVPAGSYDVLDHAISLSTTFGEALERMLRFHRVLCDAWAVSQHRQHDVVTFRRLRTMSPTEIESYFAVLVARGRALIGGDFAPVDVRFSHSLAAGTKAFSEFFACPVRDGQPFAEFSFRAADLERVAPAHDASLNRVLDRYMSEILHRLPRTDALVDRTRHAIAQLMETGTRPTLATVARRLALSKRAVQRGLELEHTTFFAVLEAERRRIAERLVGDRRLSITEISYVLGFSDLSGFRRAYRSWTGETPSATRARSR